MRKVFIVDDGYEARAVSEMFIKQGWEIAGEIEDADLVQFVGGEDVSPHLYNHSRHFTTYTNPIRDNEEVKVYTYALNMGIPMAGICRGGQFLNVMNGGWLWQDVDGHDSGHHEAFMIGGIIPLRVSSVHHQMMEPNHLENPTILLTAKESKSKHRMSALKESTMYASINRPSIDMPTDIEALHYENTNCLCFQPHPEYEGDRNKETKDVYFQFINQYLFDTTKEGE